MAVFTPDLVDLIRRIVGDAGVVCESRTGVVMLYGIESIRFAIEDNQFCLYANGAKQYVFNTEEELLVWTVRHIWSNPIRGALPVEVSKTQIVRSLDAIEDRLPSGSVLAAICADFRALASSLRSPEECRSLADALRAFERFSRCNT